MVGIAKLAMTISEIAVDATPARAMVAVVGVGESEAFQNPELSLDEIQPGRGVQTGWMRSFLSRASKRGLSCTLCRLSSTTHSRMRG